MSLDTDSWEAIYPIYSRNLKQKFDPPNLTLRIDSFIATLQSNKHKIISSTEFGEFYHTRNDIEGAKKYFENVINFNSDNKYNHLKEVQKSKSYLRAINELGIGQKAPYFKSLDINGHEIEIEKGKVTLIDFWASWCKPCREDLPIIKGIYDEYKDRDDFKIIGVSLDTDVDQLRSYLDKTI